MPDPLAQQVEQLVQNWADAMYGVPPWTHVELPPSQKLLIKAIITFATTCRAEIIERAVQKAEEEIARHTFDTPCEASHANAGCVIAVLGAIRRTLTRTVE